MAKFDSFFFSSASPFDLVVRFSTDVSPARIFAIARAAVFLASDLARGLTGNVLYVDAGDSDPATFMHYVRLAAQSLAGKRGGALPVFTAA